MTDYEKRIYDQGFKDGWAVRDQGHRVYDPYKNRSNAILIIEYIEKKFSMPLVKLSSKSRMRHIVFPRQVAVYLMSKYTSLTMTEMGALLGGRDHTTIIHSRQRIYDHLDVDDQEAQEVRLLEAGLVSIIREKGASSEAADEQSGVGSEITGKRGARKRILTPKELGLDVIEKSNRPPAEYTNLKIR